MLAAVVTRFTVILKPLGSLFTILITITCLSQSLSLTKSPRRWFQIFLCSPLVWTVTGLNSHWSEQSLVWTVTGLNSHWSEQSLVWYFPSEPLVTVSAIIILWKSYYLIPTPRWKLAGSGRGSDIKTDECILQDRVCMVDMIGIIRQLTLTSPNALYLHFYSDGSLRWNLNKYRKSNTCVSLSEQLWQRVHALPWQ